MTNLIKDYGLWGPFILTCSLIFMYHFKMILVRYDTKEGVKTKYYKKEEIDEKLKKIEGALLNHITEKELKSFEKYIDVKFEQQNTFLQNISLQQDKALDRITSEVEDLRNLITSIAIDKNG